MSEILDSQLHRFEVSRTPKERLAAVLKKQEEMKSQEIDIDAELYTVHLLPGMDEQFSADYLKNLSFISFIDAKKLKAGEKKGEIVWKIPGEGERPALVIKLVQDEKMPSTDYELRILQRIQLLELQGPEPIGMMTFKDTSKRQVSFILMKEIEGQPGMSLEKDLRAKGWSEEEIEKIKGEVFEEMKTEIAAYRKYAEIDKPWYLKDTLVQIGEDNNLEGVTILDWERAHDFDPLNPETLSIEKKPGKWEEVEV